MMRWTLALAVTLVASCTPDAPPTDDVDAASSGREFTTTCIGTRFEVLHPDGSMTADVWWYATVEQPFDWANISWRMCDVDPPSAPLATCPTGATSCSGMVPPSAVCQTGRGLQLVQGADGTGRLSCGQTRESVTSSGVRTVTGQHYRTATIRVE